MNTEAITLFYQLFYAIVPTISIIGNGFIVYVTIRSNGLRKPCNILIGLVSAGDIIHMLGHYVMLALFNFVEGHRIRHDYCAYMQCAPILGVVFSPMLLFALAVDRVLSLTKYYRNLVVDSYCIYLTLQILPASALGLTLSVWVILDSTSDGLIVCMVPTSLRGRAFQLFNKSVVVISVLIVITYVMFGFLLKETSLRSPAGWWRGYVARPQVADRGLIAEQKPPYTCRETRAESVSNKLILLC
ncbi:unnamed protein product [Nippostrongylus brasiliensis]|uniref:G_PROTEIN_RECEP_F1_2 domain-containing protein n=1 Tax=Nippostrongylus brasiliensis TaxID=27835 RepID=A0A0N4Y3J8_NIPBR|nr:unnamed protein product [Nippostrongylus brasiliensis]